MVTVWPRRIRTSWSLAGTWPPCQVDALDQLPLWALRTVTRDVSCEKSGIPSGRSNGPGATAVNVDVQIHADSAVTSTKPKDSRTKEARRLSRLISVMRPRASKPNATDELGLNQL